MGYIIFWAALRSGYIDTFSYIQMFKFSPTGFDEAIEALTAEGKNPGFDCLMVLFKTCFTDNYHWWLATIAIVSGISIMCALRKRSENYLYSIYIFITSLTVVWLFNGIRQFLVVAILFGLCHLIEERKMWKFIIAVVLCSLIHKTALIMLPMYFFVTDKPFGKRMNIFILAVLACAISIAPLMDSMDVVLQGTGYEGNLQQFAEDDGVHPLRVIFKAIPVVLAFIKRKEIIALNNNFINICVNMSAISAGLYFVGMLTSGIMIGRLPMYFELYNLILIPFLFNHIYVKTKKSFYLGYALAHLAFYFILGSNLYYISDILGNYLN
jgi:transmembrane protein EpsG